MLLKLGVDISRLKPPIRKELTLIENIFQRNGYGEAVITSTFEGNHSPGSLHYADLAVDFGRPQERPTLTLKDLLKDLKESLGPDYDVVLEGDHFHVEYDPKT